MDGWIDGWTDAWSSLTYLPKEVLIIGRVVGWSGGIPKSLVSLDSRTPGFDLHSLFFGVFLEGVFFSIEADLDEILGGFGRLKWT